MKNTAKQLISLLELSAIGSTQNIDHIKKIIANASTPFGNIKGVCVLPGFVSEAKQLIELKNANTVNVIVYLTSDRCTLTELIAVTEQALKDGADEVEIIFPAQAILDNDIPLAEQIISTIAGITHKANKKLTVILENSKLDGYDQLTTAIQVAVNCHADYLKTLNSKKSQMTKIELLKIICQQCSTQYRDQEIGIKIADGISTVDDVFSLLSIIESSFGEEWMNMKNISICSNMILPELMYTLGCSKEE